MRMLDQILTFLSIQAQDFIEDAESLPEGLGAFAFLSIQAQDFIEESTWPPTIVGQGRFLSIQAQDFIEDESLKGLWKHRPYS